MKPVLMNLDLCCVDDLVEQPLAVVRLLGRDHRADREGAQRVGDRQRALGRSLRPGEGEHVGTALALAVDVDPADLVDQRIDQRADLVRVWC